MPLNNLKELSEKTNTDMKKVKEKWEEAKEKTKEQGINPKNKNKFYAYAHSILKNLLGLKDN